MAFPIGLSCSFDAIIRQKNAKMMNDAPMMSTFSADGWITRFPRLPDSGYAPSFRCVC